MTAKRRTKGRTYHPSLRALIWHQTAERFGRAYGPVAQAEYERLWRIWVPWVEGRTGRLRSNSVRLMFKFPKPYAFSKPNVRHLGHGAYVPGPFPCWGIKSA